jgi:hypothetical protein
MDLLAIFRKLWRYRMLTAPIVALTIVGAIYVVVVQKPVYEVRSNYVLLNPPAPPTPDEIAREPDLEGVRSDNPYTRFGDQTVVIQVLAATMNSGAAERALERKGVLGPYTVAPSSEFGFASPIVQVMATGPNAAGAIQSAKIVGDAAIQELDRMQRSQGVDERYRIKAMQVDPPDKASLQASGKLRMLVSLVVLGGVILFLVTAVIDALARFRMELARDASLDDWDDEAGAAPARSAPVAAAANGQTAADVVPARVYRAAGNEPNAT